jgi:transcriptional regulator
MTDFGALVQGTLDMMVLKVLSLESMHGWGISERLGRYSGDTFRINQGSLYVALDRLQRRGWITAAWRITENNRRARYYSLTRGGRAELARAAEQWDRASGAVDLVMATTKA